MSGLPNLVRAMRSLLGGVDRYSATPFADLQRAYIIAQQGVRAFYVASALYLWIYLPQWHQSVINNPPLDHAWPLAWAEGFSIIQVIDVLGVAGASFAVLAFWKPAIRAYRIGFTLCLLQCAALPASLGAVNHIHHEWIWISFLLIFLPAADHASKPSRAVQLSYVLTFAATQGLILMFYTMAGLWKTLAGVASLVQGAAGNFSPGSLSWTLADRMAQTNTQPLLGPFMVENSLIAYPMFLILIYAQLVAVVVAFRPSLHRIWAFILIAFHTGTFLLMEIAFPSHIAILVFLFVASPFQREDWVKLETLIHLPIFGDLYRRFAARPKSQSNGAEQFAT